MPSFETILGDTMLAAAAFGDTGGFNIAAELIPDQDLNPPKPTGELSKFGGGRGIIDATIEGIDVAKEQMRIEKAKLWHWEYASGQVREIRNVTCRARAMGGMAATVCDKIVFHELRVKFTGQPERVVPLESRYEIGRKFLPKGKIPAATSGRWQLPARVDASFMNVLAYQLESTGWEPLTMQDLIDLGEDAMPTGNLVDYLEFKFGGNDVVTGTVAKPRLVVVLSLVCCKERNDCEPSESLAAARIYPQMMVMANVNIEFVEGTIEMWRPPTSPHAHHHPEMMGEIESLVFTDTNQDHTVHLLPVPRWDEIFDYYHLDPHGLLAARSMIPETAPEGTLPNEACFVSHKTGGRDVEDAVWRFREKFEGEPGMTKSDLEGTFYTGVQTIKKLQGQAEFDNIHLAPHMRVAFETHKTVIGGRKKEKFEHIVMAPFCVHDCLHTHLRWGDVKLPPLLSMPKSNKGWFGDQPYAMVGAPLVPGNQSVYISLPEKHAFRYRAVAHQVFAGAWTVFNHHGSYYATGEWPGTANMALEGAKFLIDLAVEGDEPWTDDDWGEMPSPAESWAALYWRLRYGGYQDEDHLDRNTVFERLAFDLDKCMR